jgi:1,4-dihydroxy-2-naphthoyl-CoA hydrolase
MSHTGRTALPDDAVLAVPVERCFDAQYGLEIVEDDIAGGLIRGRVEVRDEVKQPFGLLHGGVLASIAEALASRATYFAVAERGMVAMGMSNETTFLRPIFSGFVHTEARVRDRGTDSWVWDAEHRDDEGRLCSVSTVRVAVRAPR